METFRSSSSAGKDKRSGSRTGSHQDSPPPRPDSGTGPPVFDADYFDCTFVRPDQVKKSQGSASHEPPHLPQGAARADTRGSSVRGTQRSPQPRGSRCPVDGEIIHGFWENEPESEPTDKARPVRAETLRPDLTQEVQPLRNAAARLPFYWGASVLVLLISLLAYLTYLNDSNFGSEAIDQSPSRQGVQGRVRQVAETDARDSDILHSVTQLLSAERTLSPGNGRTGLSARKPADATTPGFQGPTRKTVSTPPVEQERPTLPGHGNKAGAVSPEEEHSGDSVSLGTIVSHLQVVELQQKGYELALELMNARPGAFSGFFPDRSIPGVSYVRKFESRIVELEMKKKALAVQFNPNSREIQSIDQEIKGIRDCVKEYIGEQLVFLQKRKQRLLAQKSELERRVGSRGPSKTGSKVLWLPHDSSFEGTEGVWLHEEQSDPGQLMSVNQDGVVSRVSSGLASLVGETKEKLKSFPFWCSLDEDMPRQPYGVAR